MKGLVSPPSKKDLITSYTELIHLSRHEEAAIDLARFALLTQWVRFDPRLGELWLNAFKTHWKKLSPFVLNQETLKQPWPSVLGVLLAQCEIFYLPKSESLNFKHWSKLALSGIQPEPYQNFFIGLSVFRSPSDEEPFFYPMSCYTKFGYFGNELFINKSAQKISELKPVLYSQDVRKRVLKNLVKKQNRITVKDYLAALHQGIHPRLAEKDLANAEFLVGIGNTRAKFYRSKTAR